MRGLGAGGLGVGGCHAVGFLAVNVKRDLVAVEGDGDMGLIAHLHAVEIQHLGLYWLSIWTRSVVPVRKIDMCSASPLWKMASRE
jgi:glyoxylate carboligase